MKGACCYSPEVQQILQCKHCQGAEVLSIIFLLPWNCLVSGLFALACAAVSICAMGGEVVTGQRGCTWLSEAQPPHGGQQEQGESVRSQMDEKSRFPPRTRPALPNNHCHP